jgi:predicted NAD-dependent protein-ADP-ribosyltransferase YbiA (DUF1768 family)
MSVIHFYDPKSDYGWMSNYYKAPFKVENITYPTSEHYYQVMKFLDCGENGASSNNTRNLEYAQLILSQNTPNKCKILATQKKGGQNFKWKSELNKLIDSYRDVKIRSDWEDVKDNVMRFAVMKKFTQNAALRDKLLLTGDATLVEHSKDAYWGDGLDRAEGLNMLGKILMEVRYVLRGDFSINREWMFKDIVRVGNIDFSTTKVDVIFDAVHDGILDVRNPEIMSYRCASIYQPENLYSVAAEVSRKNVCYIYATPDQCKQIYPFLLSYLYGV